MTFAQDRLKINHFLIPYIALLAAVLGGVVVNGGVSWYYGLNLPSWHPSALLIMTGGTLIYACGAWSLMIVWNSTREHGFSWIVRGFGFLVLLNLLWSVTFFQFHLLLLSPLSGIVFGCAVLVLMKGIWPISRKASLLLAPFALWIMFALLVQYSVLVLNT